jgi:hypothetical protein
MTKKEYENLEESVRYGSLRMFDLDIDWEQAKRFIEWFEKLNDEQKRDFIKNLEERR